MMALSSSKGIAITTVMFSALPRSSRGFAFTARHASILSTRDATTTKKAEEEVVHPRRGLTLVHLVNPSSSCWRTIRGHGVDLSSPDALVQSTSSFGVGWKTPPPRFTRNQQQQQRLFFFNRRNKEEEDEPLDNLQVMTVEEENDFENLIYIAQKRNVKVTVKKGTQAGVACGLCIMGGTVVGGPPGAIVGGIVGTVIAVRISRKVISLNQMLKATPRHKKREVYKLFSQAIREEFQGGLQENPELKLLMGGGSILNVIRYCLDRDMMEKEKLEKLDRILEKVRGDTKALEG